MLQATPTETMNRRPEWAGEPIRIDPAAGDRRQVLERREPDGETVSYRIERRGVAVRRHLPGVGAAVTVALPPTAFRGVAARAMESADGAITVTLELLHADPQLCVPLLVATDLFDVAADWRGWSELFGLPMLMVESDGSVSALEETVGLLRAGQPAPRRSGSSPNRRRRPRFLARRRMGGLGMRMVVAGEEIIARR